MIWQEATPDPTADIAPESTGANGNGVNLNDKTKIEGILGYNLKQPATGKYGGIMKKISQQKKILELLISKKSVTNLELNQICFRYSSRIHDLKQKNIFVSDAKYVKQGVYEYQLLTKPEFIDMDKCCFKEKGA